MFRLCCDVPRGRSEIMQEPLPHTALLRRRRVPGEKRGQFVWVTASRITSLCQLGDTDMAPTQNKCTSTAFDGKFAPERFRDMQNVVTDFVPIAKN